MRTKEWNELLEFETRDLVERFIREKHNRNVNAWKVNEITSNFIQSREFFKSAHNADFSVSPLLQYYGVVSLSRALILSLSPTVNEANLKASHGLNVTNWKEVLKNKNYGSLEISVGDGIFTELLNVTGNKNLLRANSSVVNWTTHLNPPKKGDSIRLSDLIQYFPDLHREYKTWTEENLHYVILRTLIEKDSKIELQLSNNIDHITLDKMFPETYCKGRLQNGHLLTYDVCNWYPNITQLWDSAFEIGDACVIPVFKNDIGLNQLGGMFMISYVFGMMARYFPTSWISLRRVERGDKIYPFAHRIIEFIDDKYPRVVLDFLRNIDK